MFLLACLVYKLAGTFTECSWIKKPSITTVTGYCQCFCLAKFKKSNNINTTITGWPASQLGHFFSCWVYLPTFAQNLLTLSGTFFQRNGTKKTWARACRKKLLWGKWEKASWTSLLGGQRTSWFQQIWDEIAVQTWSRDVVYHLE